MSLDTEAPPRSRRRTASPPPELDSAGPDPQPGFRLPYGLASGRFIFGIAVILAGGLVSLLAINTSLAGGAITLSGMEGSLARSREHQQALQVHVQGLSSPEALQQAAVDLGMVPAAAPAFLDPATGLLSGALEAAAAPAKPPVAAPQVAVPSPIPTPGAPDGSSPTPNPNDPASPPAPVPTPTQPVDPGSDGATLERPTVIAGQTPADGTPTAPDSGLSGDSAAVTGPVAD